MSFTAFFKCHDPPWDPQGAGDPGKRFLADPTRRPDRAHALTDTYYDDTKYI